MSSDSLPDRTEVCVVGAGTAGAAAAGFLARAGLRVLCIDRGPIDRAGASWVNGVLASDFDDAGLARPAGEELLSSGGPFNLVAGYGPTKITIEGHGVLEVDMRRLVERLQGEARDAGAVLIGHTTVRDFTRQVLRTDRGQLRAELVVDAGGITGPSLLGQPRLAPAHLCAAAQQVRRLADPAGARSFFERHGVPMGQVLCFTGIAGGYSILNLRSDGEHLSILTGSIPAAGHPSGAKILADFVSEQPWIGELVFGGSRAIPIRRPFDRISTDRAAAIGDAAAQVFPAHGSGIGAGMVAARYLTDAIATGAGPHEYATRWQRARGGLFASYDLFRRFSQTLSVDQLATMMNSGIMDPTFARAGMAQELPRPSIPMLLAKLPALARNPAIALRMSRVLTRMAAARALYARYPRRIEDLPTWSRRIARIFCEPPDPVAP